MDQAALICRIEALEKFLRDETVYCDAPAKHFDHNDSWPDESQVVSHVLYVLAETRKLVASGNLSKAFRWLGFAQGALWVAGLYSIHELQTIGAETTPGVLS